VSRLAAGRAPPYVVRGRRIAGAAWEIAVDPL
jgi:hypothetical protein